MATPSSMNAHIACSNILHVSEVDLAMQEQGNPYTLDGIVAI